MFVDGLAPITPLLVAQFQAALQGPRRCLASLSLSGGALHIGITHPGRASAVTYYLDRLYITHTAMPLDEVRLEAGDHVFEVDAKTARAREAFAVARCGSECLVTAKS